MSGSSNKQKTKLFKNDKITLVRSDGNKMPGKVTELSGKTFWVKYKNVERLRADSKLGDTVNMVLHYEQYEMPFSAKVIQRNHAGKAAVDVCYEADDNTELVQRHEQQRKTVRIPVYTRRIMNIHDHTEYVTKPSAVPKDLYLGEQSKYASCRTLDISASGMRIQSVKVMEKGESLECVISLDSATILTTATIMSKQQRRSGVFEYGIKFEKIHPDNVKKIVKFVYNEGEPLSRRSIFSKLIK